nr:class I SAM-dependent methyltransferase [Microbacterium bovistercoris]
MDAATLAASFQSTGEDYDRYRPGFPEAAVDVLLAEPVAAVLDLGAGTGKLTAALLPRASRVIAVDPSEQMLAVLRRKLPQVEALLGTAEAIPLPDQSVDAVVVAQAFHWFDRDAACAEIARVLVPTGTLGLVWNGPDPTCPWDQACGRIAHPERSPDEPGDEDAEALPGFTLLAREQVRWREQIARADYLARWHTVSTFLAASAGERARMAGEVEDILDADAQTRGRDILDLPTVAGTWLYRRAR